MGILAGTNSIYSSVYPSNPCLKKIKIFKI
jgi:hypothetical protein